MGSLTIALILMAFMLVLGLMPRALWTRPNRAAEIVPLQPVKVATRGTMSLSDNDGDCAAA
jgi:hypothetical protein